MTELKRQQNGMLYNPLKVHIPQYSEKKELVRKFNASAGISVMERMDFLRKVFAHMGTRAYIEPPFYCDHGWKISVGDNFYANTGFLVLDEAEVNIGNNAFISPRERIKAVSEGVSIEANRVKHCIAALSNFEKYERHHSYGRCRFLLTH